jgi:hypothetical protein
MHLLQSLPKELLEILISYLNDISIILKLYPEIKNNKFFWVDKINSEFDNFYLSTGTKTILDFYRGNILESLASPKDLINFYEFLKTQSHGLQMIAYGKACKVYALNLEYLIIEINNFISDKIRQMVSPSFKLLIYHPRASSEAVVMDLEIYDSKNLSNILYIAEEYKEFVSIIRNAKKWILVLRE